MRALNTIAKGEKIVVKVQVWDAYRKVNTDDFRTVTVVWSGVWGEGDAEVRFLSYYADHGTTDLSYATESGRGNTWSEIDDATESGWVPGTYTF